MTPQTPTAYDRRTIVLHWLTALLVIGLWVVGQTIDDFAKGTPRITVRSLHISSGLLLAALLAFRIYWRRGGGTRLPAADPGLMGKVGVGAHHLLYALTATVLLMGIATTLLRGDNMFGLFHMPKIDLGDPDMAEEVMELHGTFANGLLILAGLHASAALYHHFLRKDGVLRRMWPKR
jgi:cytochrome b561